jgi:hypothetical protein
MVTFRNRRTPSGNCALISVNTETVRGWKPGIGDDSKRLDTLANGERSKRSATIVEVARAISYRAMFRRSSGPLLGVRASKPNRGCLSANKGTRETRWMRVVTRPSRLTPGQAPPMRPASGGVAVVVRDWESQLHGEGRQEVSFWKVEALHRERGRSLIRCRTGNREGSR